MLPRYTDAYRGIYIQRVSYQSLQNIDQTYVLYRRDGSGRLIAFFSKIFDNVGKIVVVAWRIHTGAKPLPEPMLAYFHL